MNWALTKSMGSCLDLGGYLRINWIRRNGDSPIAKMQSLDMRMDRRQTDDGQKTSSMMTVKMGTLSCDQGLW